jgi:VanZ family protein
MYKIGVGLTVVLCGFVAWLIGMENLGQPTVFSSWSRATPYGDKMAHILVFGLLTLAANGVTRLKMISLGRLKLLLGTVLVCLFAVIEELSQHFIASRTLSAGDLAADVVGIGLCSLWCVYCKKRSNGIQSHKK